MYPADLSARRAATRALLASAVTRYALAHATEIRARDFAIQTGEERRQEVVPPQAIEVTVGIGKSHSVANIIVPMIYGADMPLLILAPTRDLCNDYAKAIRASGIDCTVYRPREAVEQGSYETTPFSCFQVGHINKAGERHQRPAQSICRQCPNGHKRALESDNKDTHERAVKWFSRNGYTPPQIGEIQPCRYLYEGLPQQLQAEVLIAPASAFSEALATVKREYVDSNGRYIEKNMQRLIITDERLEMTEKVRLSTGSIDGWIGAIDRVTKNLTEGDARITALNLVRHALASVGAALIQERPLDNEIRESIRLAHQSLRKAELIDGGTALFERVSFMPDDEDFLIPLRAFSALHHAMNQSTDEVDTRSIRLAVPKPLVEWMVRRGSTIVLDATLDPTLRELIKAKGGSILDAQTPQNIEVKRVTGKMFARGKVGADDYQIKAQRELRHLASIAEKMPKPAAIITHKAFLAHISKEDDAQAIADAFEQETGVAIGWFGKHDRGHNDWAGRHIAVVGMPIFSPSTINGLWQERRVLMNLIGQEVAPIEPQEANEGAFVPNEASARAWLFNIYASTLVQAIGRARGINHEGDDPLQVHLYGGIVHPDMDAALAHSLIEIDRVEPYSEAVAIDRSNDPRLRVRAAIEEVAKGAAGVSRRAVEARLDQAGHKAKTTIILDEIKRWKADHPQRDNDPRWRIRAAIEEVAKGRKGAAGVSRRAVEAWLNRAGHKVAKATIILDEIGRWRDEQAARD